ncbi:MAG: hypothetical protein HYY40_00485 [Bacteroidetes bacterium]|nr:hypothetical protein [Bacteroidota bacterium]
MIKGIGFAILVSDCCNLVADEVVAVIHAEQPKRSTPPIWGEPEGGCPYCSSPPSTVATRTLPYPIVNNSAPSPKPVTS